MDAKGFVVLPGQAPTCEMQPGRLAALKLQSGQTGESVMVFEEVMPAGAETPLHLHHGSDEVACVLSGEFTFKIGHEVSVGGPGTCAFMPRGIAHAWKNTGVEAGRALFIYTPAEAGKLFEDFRRAQSGESAIPLSSGATFADFAELYQRHGWEVLGPPPF